MDCIQIKGLETYAKHGVFAEENYLGQKFIVSAKMFVDIRAAAKNDDIDQSVNYGDVSYYIRDWMQTHTYKLIETVADCLAGDILMQFPLVQKLELEIEKPNAPIAMSFQSVSVTVTKEWHRVFIGIGSNLGDRETMLQDAMKKLAQKKGCRIKKVSSVIETEPYGYTNQGAFLNACAEVETLENPEAFLELLHEVEAELFRTREIHWGPRTIDLDILLFDDRIIDTETLTIPHKDMQNRQFVLEPLSEIAGWLRHPVYGKTIDEMWKELQQKQ